ncbi:uncharacterized protein LOC129725915 [Wyeomyia smithii]|uniref:uncharacterized protein LOC129725915 n=1 Tax=Wyeomyia smithii TaxID=174621 RepID=UPI002467FBE0|nr:uncharacterized protein LOC129725915 [Wyeomyia smithii]
MTSGHKHLYSCVTFIVFMVVINFYKNKINQAREREAFVRAKAKANVGGQVGRHAFHQTQARKQHLLHLDEFGGRDESDSWYDFSGESSTEAGVPEYESILDRMREYPEVCRDMEVFYFSREKTFETFNSRKLRERKPAGSQITTDHDSNSSMYVFLSVLIILLIAAAVDIAKHIRDIPRQDNIRRLSLQNYQTLIREKQKQFRLMKQHYSQPSMSFGGSFDDPAAIESDVKRIFGTPPKPNQTALLRRQSVPAFSCRPATGKQLFRRPSADSFASAGEVRELDSKGIAKNGSPTEIRRRVRMIHRH